MIELFSVALANKFKLYSHWLLMIELFSVALANEFKLYSQLCLHDLHMCVCIKGQFGTGTMSLLIKRVNCLSSTFGTFYVD